MSFLQYPKNVWNEITVTGSASTASGTFATLLTLGSITVTGAYPVWMQTHAGALYADAASGTIQAQFAFYRDATQLCIWKLESYVYGGGANRIMIPASLTFKDAPAAGSYIYTLRALISGGSQVGVDSVKLVAFEGFHF